MRELTKSLQRFIETNIELIELGEIEKLYELLENESPVNISAFGSILKSLDINPLEKLERVPHWYQYNNQNIYGEVIPEHIKAIGSNAYDNCKELKQIDLGKTTFISSYAFMNSGLEKIHIPGTCMQISMAAFMNCKDLTEIIIEEGLVNISSRAFKFIGAKEIKLPASITFLGNSIFDKNIKLLVPKDNQAIERYLDSSKHMNYEYYE
jgi:hypothetical protein